LPNTLLPTYKNTVFHFSHWNAHKIFKKTIPKIPLHKNLIFFPKVFSESQNWTFINVQKRIPENSFGKKNVILGLDHNAVNDKKKISKVLLNFFKSIFKRV